MNSVDDISLQKHPYANILKILPPKNENFQIKNSDIFQDSAQNIDCGYSLESPRRGGSNEYPQSVFWAEIRKIMIQEGQMSVSGERMCRILFNRLED